MINKPLKKDLYREIKNTLPRFASIFLISLLGVAFFSGIKSAEPDIRYTGHAYMDRNNLMDIRVNSTLGLTEDDAQAIRDIHGVQTAQGGYSIDLLSEKDNSSSVLKVFSVMEDLNKIEVKEGRFPNAISECIMDSDYAHTNGYKIGDEMYVSDQDGEKSSKMNEHKFRVVGIGSTPEYITFSRGTSAQGSGVVEGFIAVPPQSFNMEAYTKIDVKIQDKHTSFTPKYNDEVDKIIDKVNDIAEHRSQIRYNDVIDESESKISQAQNELDVQKIDAFSKLDEAKYILDTSKQELENAKTTLNESKTAYLNSIQSVEQGQKMAEEGYKEIYKNELRIKDFEKTYKDGYNTLYGLQTNLTEVQEAIRAYEQMHLPVPKELIEQKNALLKAIDTLENELQNSTAKINLAKEEIKKGKEELKKQDNELKQAQIMLEDVGREIKKGEATLNENELKLNQSEIEYARNRQEVENQFKSAQKEIDENTLKLSEISFPKWHIFSRSILPGYDEYGENADRIKAIGNVFPIIFFLVAILISLTTITRMVEEQRTQIGVLKALGYSGTSIAYKYIAYAFLATIGGGILGSLVGGKLIPYVIIKAYKIMYANMPDIVIPYNIGYSLLAIIVAVLCSVAAALLACIGKVKNIPAVLMRPHSPKSGKRILLEKISFLWRRLSFSYKATFRNLFRYKKRLLMTVLGISGCMALMIVGFGIHDSISDIIPLQFEHIQRYDGAVVFDSKKSTLDIDELKNMVLADNRIQTESLVLSQNIKVEKDGIENKQVSIVVPQDNDKMEELVTLRDRKTKEVYSLKDDNVIITEKLANLLNIKQGDTIRIDDGKREVDVLVSKIVENYLYHYVYMSGDLYAKLFDSNIAYNVINFRLNPGHTSEEVGKDLLSCNATLNVTYIDTLKNEVSNMFDSLTSVIAVLVISAGLLAFVVLYNLNNINITERIRELASIKVLGFTDFETAKYVYRENIYLTFIGIVVGVLFGFLLHKYIISTVEIDTCMFGRVIKIPSYIYSILFTIGFSVFVNLAMYFRLKKIDMVESLKSVE